MIVYASSTCREYSFEYITVYERLEDLICSKFFNNDIIYEIECGDIEYCFGALNDGGVEIRNFKVTKKYSKEEIKTLIDNLDLKQLKAFTRFELALKGYRSKELSKDEMPIVRVAVAYDAKDKDILLDLMKDKDVYVRETAEFWYKRKFE